MFVKVVGLSELPLKVGVWLCILLLFDAFSRGYPPSHLLKIKVIALLSPTQPILPHYKYQQYEECNY